MENWWNNIERGRQKYWEKNLSYCLSTKNPTWTDLETNRGLDSDKTPTNRLSHGTAPGSYIYHNYIANPVRTVR